MTPFVMTVKESVVLKLRVKQARYRPGMAQRVPES